MVLLVANEAAAAAVAVVCLQARRVTGVPVAVQHVHLACCRLGGGASSASVDARGVADFRSEVLLLHCGGAASGAESSLVVEITVSVSVSSSSPRHRRRQQLQQQQLRLVVDGQPPQGGDQHPCRVLSFVLGGAAAGAVLTLALHHRLVRPPPATTTTRSTSSCMPGCCRRSKTRRRRGHFDSSSDDDDEQSDDGFIVIEKQAGRRRLPLSESLATTDEQDTTQKLELDVDGSRVEDEFLAILELADANADLELELDMLIRDAEAELAIAHLLKDQDAIHDVN